MTLKTPTEELKIKYETLKKDGIFYRGVIIDEVIVMEFIIDEILANYFCEKEKIDEITSIVFNTEFVSLGGKTKMLQSLFLKEKFKKFHKENTDLIGEIERLTKLRNKLAHSKLSSTDEDVKNYVDEIPFINYVNGEKSTKLIYKRSELKIKLTQIENVINKLREFLKEINSLQS